MGRALQRQLCAALSRGSWALLWAVHAFPWLTRSFAQESYRLQSHQVFLEELGRKFPVPGEDTEKEAVSGCGFSGLKVQPERAQSCDVLGMTGVSGCRLYHRPLYGQQDSVSPGPRHLFSRCWACPVIPQSLPRFLRSCSSSLVALTTTASLCNPNMLFCRMIPRNVPCQAQQILKTDFASQMVSFKNKQRNCLLT